MHRLRVHVNIVLIGIHLIGSCGLFKKAIPVRTWVRTFSQCQALKKKDKHSFLLRSSAIIGPKEKTKKRKEKDQAMS